MEEKNNQEEQDKEQKQKRTFRICTSGKGKGRSDYPASDKIGSRSSTIARAMASTLMPRIGATDEERRKIVKLSLGNNAKKEDNIIVIPGNLKELKCVYCGNKATNFDHLFPFIRDKQPTGYFTEPANLVPCCDECNQRKGSKNWDDYMTNLITADNGNSDDLEQRMVRLKEYCQKTDYSEPTGDSESDNVQKLSFSDDILLKWWDPLRKKVVNALDEAQIQIDAFKAGVKYSICQPNTKMDECFKQYFKGLIQEEIDALCSEQDVIINAKSSVKRAKNAVKRAKDAIAKADTEDKRKKKQEQCKKKINELKEALDIYNRAIDGIEEKTISNLLKQNNESTDNTKQIRLLDHGFRINNDWNNVEDKVIYESALNGFTFGFEYAKQNDRATLERCINRGWLDDIIISKTEEP